MVHKTMIKTLIIFQMMRIGGGKEPDNKDGVGDASDDEDGGGGTIDDEDCVGDAPDDEDGVSVSENPR